MQTYSQYHNIVSNLSARELIKKHFSAPNMFRFIVALIVVLGVSAFVAPKMPRSSVMMMAEKSKSIPFLDAPANLAGMVGDKGYDL